jgi:hypothetical protein
MDLLTGLIAGIGVAAGVQTVMVWRATRAMTRLASIEARVERFSDALTLLTDTTESAFRAVAAEMARTPGRAERIAPAVSAARTRRIARAATRGASVQQIAAAEEVAESEVRLRLQMANDQPASIAKPDVRTSSKPARRSRGEGGKNGAKAIKAIAKTLTATTTKREGARGAVRLD